MKGVELLVVVLVIATALGAIGYLVSPGITGLQVLNQPPTQLASTVQADTLPLVLSLDDYFFDPDGDALTYFASDDAISVDGALLTLDLPPGSPSEYFTTITVTDGTNTVAKPFMFILPVGETQMDTPVLSSAQTQEKTRGTLQEQPISLPTSTEELQTSNDISSSKGISTTCGDCTDCSTCASTPGDTCTLTADIDSTDTCITVSAAGVTIDCAGFNITYASTTDNSYGIDTSLASNTIITGCNITQTDATFQASPAINLGTSTGGFQVINSRIITPGQGISGTSVTSLIVQNTNFNLSSGASGFLTNGIDVTGTNIIIRNNSFSATGNGVGIDSFGSTLVNISNNTFSIAGTTPGNALELNINHSNVSGNRMIATTSNSNFNGQNVTVTDNRFRSLNWVTGTNFTWRNNRASSTGEHVFDPRTGNASSINDTFTGRLVLRSINFTMHNSTFNSTSIGVLRVAGMNITIENASARASGGIHLIGVNGSGHILSNITIQATATPLLNLTNTTNSTFTNLNLSTTSTWISFIGTITDNRFFNINMSTSNGSIFYPEFNVSQAGILNRTNVTITFNQTFVNTTGLPFLNQSAQIQLRGLTFTDPRILIDTDDDGTYATCAEPDCTEISYNGSTIIFNVSHFTSHAISEGANTHPTIAQVILNSSDGSGETGNNATTSENLTVVVINATDADNDSVQNITDWRVNGVSLAVFNAPFETNVSLNTTSAIGDYSTFANNGSLGNGSSLTTLPVWTSSGRAGGAYTFDGTDDVIDFTDASALDFFGDFSLEVWVRTTQTLGAVNYAAIAGKGHLQGGVNGYGLFLNGDESNSNVTFQTRNDVTAVNAVGTSVNDGNWHHVVGVRDHTNNLTHIYVDGVLRKSASGNLSNYSSDTRFAVGGRHSTGSLPLPYAWFYSGSVDEVRAYNRSLSAAQIYQLYLDGNASKHIETVVSDELLAGDTWSVAVTPNDQRNASDGTTVLSNTVSIIEVSAVDPIILNSSDGSGYAGNNASDSENLTIFLTDLGTVKNISDWRINGQSIALLYLPFEGGSNSTFTKDYSTNSNNGTVLGPTWNSTGGFDGFGAYQFDGVNDFIELGNRTSLNGRGPVSISAWVNTTGINGDIVSKFGDADLNDSYVLRVNSAGQAMFSVSSAGFKDANSLSIINNGQYHHVMGVFTGTAVQIYVNGTLENSTAVSGTIDASNATVKIGRGGYNVSAFGGEHFNGTLDEVMIFNRSFSSTQVSQYYSDLLTYRTLTTLVSDQTLAGQNWAVNVTTNNGTADTGGNVSNSITILGSIVSGNKTDTVDPVTNGQQFTYRINVSVTNSTAHNVTVIESYPSGLSFVSSQPTPTSGNNVFALGDLSNTTFTVNVTVQVTTGVTQGYGNVVNISYNDAEGYNYSQTLIESTAYISIVECSSCVGCTSCLANAGAYCRATNAITGTLTCINMTADNTTFDCNGFELNYGTAGGSNQVGIAAANRNNILIKNCFVRDTAAAGLGSVGINFTNVDNSIIQDNNVTTNGTTLNFGIRFTTSSTNNTIERNNITARGTSFSNYAIYLLAGSNLTRIQHNLLTPTGPTSGAIGVKAETNIFNTTIYNNTIITSGTGVSNYGIAFDVGSTGNNTINNNTIRTNGTSATSNNVGVRLVGSYNNSVANNIINTNGTSDNYGIIVATAPCDNNTIISNTVNTRGTSSDNTAIRLVNVCGNTLVQGNNITTYGTTSNVGIATFLGHSNITLRDNTIYPSGSGGQNIGIALNDASNYSIFNNIISTNGTASNHGLFLVRINHTNISNNSVQTQGTSNDNLGININTNGRNHTVFDNTISTNGTSDNHAILLTGSVTNNTVSSNIISTNGTNNNFGIAVQSNSQNNNIQNNSITTSGSGDFNPGITISGNSSYQRVIGNTVNSGGATAYNWGIDFASSNYANITSNSVMTNGTSQNQGIHIDFGANNTTITYNRVVTDGSAGNNHGITVGHNSDNTTVEHNTVITYGTTQGHGLRVTSFSNNSYWNNNTVTTHATGSYGIVIGSGGGGGGAGTPGGADISTFNNTRLINVTQWISVFDSNLSTLWNTSFELPNGTILIPANFSLGSALNITRTRLNIVNNTAFIDTTAVSALNTSAEITLNGLNASTPRLIVDYNDDLLAEYCDPPKCTLESYTGGTLRFNVSSFTSYSSSGNMSVDKNDTPDPVTAGQQLNYTITIVNEGNDTLINTTAVETYPSDVAFDSSSPAPDLGNNTWLLGNLTNGTVTTINITLNVSGALANGTVLNNSVNVTFANNEGINVSTVDLENTTVITSACPLVVSTDTTLAVNITCPATAINITSDNLTLDCAGYNVTYASSSAGVGVSLAGRTNVTVLNCNIAQTTSANSGSGISVSSSNNISILNNNLSTLHLFSAGISISSGTSHTVAGNNVTVNGTGTVDGITLNSATNSTVENNTARTPGNTSSINGAINIVTGNNISFSNNSGISNNSPGIIFTNTVNSTLFNNSGFSSDNQGLLLFESTFSRDQNNTVINSTGTSTTSTGLSIQSGANRNAIIGSRGNSVTSIGIWLRSDRSTINNSIGTSSSNIGIRVDGTANAVDYSAGSGSTGISLQAAGSNSDINLTNSNGTTTTGTGISVAANYANISNVLGTATSGFGIQVSGSNSRNNSIRNSTFLSNTGQALRLDGASAINNSIVNTTLRTNATWVRFIANPSENHFENTLFDSTNGSILIIPQVTPAVPAFIVDITTSQLNTSLNRSFLNSTNLTEFNTTAQITLRGINFTDPRPRVDFEDDGIFAVCNPPQCTEVSYTSGAYVFNVSSFTSYAASENATTCPLDITTSTTLTENISCPRTAINILADNVALDCAGYNISYATTGSGTVVVNGINVTGRDNVTIRNCAVSAATNKQNAIAINFESADNGTVENSSARARGSSSNGLQALTSETITITDTNSTATGAGSSGISIQGGSGHTLERVLGNSSVAAGIELTGTLNSTLSNSTVIGTGTANGLQILSSNGTTVENLQAQGTNAVFLSSSHNNTVENVSVQGAGDFQLSTAHENTVRNISLARQVILTNSHRNNLDRITDSGLGRLLQLFSSGGNMIGNSSFQSTDQQSISLTTSGNNTFLNITARSLMESVASLTTSHNNTFNALNATGGGDMDTVAYTSSENNTITNSTLTHMTMGPPSAASVLALTTSNQNLFNETALETNASWMTSSGTGNTLANITFRRTDGSMKFSGGIANNPETITLQKLNILANFSFVNSTNLTFLNTTGQVTLNGLTFVDPLIAIDTDDDGTFVLCNPPECTEISYLGGIYVFNVTHFTSYALQENLTYVINISAEKTDSPDPITAGTTLSYTITINNTGNATAQNVTVIEGYPAGVVFVSGQPTPSGNDTFSVGNILPSSSFAINITVNVSSALASGTILNNTANVTFTNSSGENGTATTSQTTTVTTAAPPAGGSGGGGGGSNFFRNANVTREQSAQVVPVSFPAVAPSSSPAPREIPETALAEGQTSTQDSNYIEPEITQGSFAGQATATENTAANASTTSIAAIVLVVVIALLIAAFTLLKTSHSAQLDAAAPQKPAPIAKQVVNSAAKPVKPAKPALKPASAVKNKSEFAHDLKKLNSDVLAINKMLRDFDKKLKR